MRFVVLLLSLFIINAYARDHEDRRHCNPRKDKHCHHDNKHDHQHNNNYAGADGEAVLIVSSILSITVTTLLTSEYYNQNDKKDKRIIKARPDAAAYIATEGKFNSAYLEQALRILRQQHPYISDIELAKAILAF